MAGSTLRQPIWLKKARAIPNREGSITGWHRKIWVKDWDYTPTPIISASFGSNFPAWNTFTAARNCALQGLYVELGAFKLLVYLDFREVEDNEAHPYRQLAAQLGGRGVANIEDALREMLNPPAVPAPASKPEPIKLSVRASGILLHPTSLPGRFGIGDLGDAAYRFVDFLAASSQHYWQVMPLGPTSYGDSPYQALSALAGNPLLISLERLVAEHTLAPWDFDGAPLFTKNKVDYGPVIEFKQRLLHISFENFKTARGDAQKKELAAFTTANKSWLEDYALFAALKDHHAGRELECMGAGYRHARAGGPRALAPGAE